MYHSYCYAHTSYQTYAQMKSSLSQLKFEIHQMFYNMGLAIANWEHRATTFDPSHQNSELTHLQTDPMSCIIKSCLLHQIGTKLFSDILSSQLDNSTSAFPYLANCRAMRTSFQKHFVHHGCFQYHRIKSGNYYSFCQECSLRTLLPWIY